MNISEDEYEQLKVFREAIDLLFDAGRWERVDGKLVWVIDEATADKVHEMIGVLDA